MKSLAEWRTKTNVPYVPVSFWKRRRTGPITTGVTAEYLAEFKGDNRQREGTTAREKERGKRMKRERDREKES